MLNSTVMHCGLKIAKAQIDAAKAGDLAGAELAHNRLFDLVCEADSPDLAVIMIARRLGRNQALQVQIDPDVIEMAIRNYVVTPQGEVYHA
jgi:hypothetical protein